MTPQQEIEHLRAVALGAQQAMQAVVGALIEMHPDRQALAASIELQAQEGLTHLTNNPYPEASVNTFHAVMERLRYCLTSTPPSPNSKT